MNTSARLAVAAVLVAGDARAEPFRDPHGHFFIDLDTSGLCVVIPARDACADAYAAQRALATPAGANALVVATNADGFEVVSVVRASRGEVDIDEDAIATVAHQLAESARTSPTVRASGHVTTHEERVHDAQMVTYATNLEVDTPQGTKDVRWETRVLYGQGVAYSVTLIADQNSVEDARQRIGRAITTARIDPALPPSRGPSWWLWALLGGMIGVELVRRYVKVKVGP